MIPLKSPSRRAVVLGLLASMWPLSGVSGAPLWLHRRFSRSSTEGRRRAKTLVAASACRRRSAVRVGARYLRMVPEERNVDALVALILQRLPDPERLMNEASSEQIRSAIALSVRDDFGQARIARLQGWTLSQTEARLAALATLI